MVNQNSTQNKKSKSSQASRLSLAKSKQEMIPTLTLKPYGIEMTYIDFADGERYTDVDVYFSKFDRHIIKLCKDYAKKAKRAYGSVCFEMDGRINYPRVKIQVCRRTLTFTDVGIIDKGIVAKGINKESELRRVAFYTSDLMAVRDMLPTTWR